MQVTFTNTQTNEVKQLSIEYVWDRSDKYLVGIDHTEKKKYVFNAWCSDFNFESVKECIFGYCEKILKWQIAVDNVQVILFNVDGQVNKVCHNDDFHGYYLPDYEVVYCSGNNNPLRIDYHYYSRVF